MGWVDYDSHARTRPRSDVWGQVRRTVGGHPYPAEQIDLIVDAILCHLDLKSHDVLLDLGCGNGALGALLRPFCAATCGVDASEYLIGVATERFAAPDQRFVVEDAASFCEAASDAGRYTKALCYGSLSYFEDELVARMLSSLHARFPALTHVLLGNLPDLARVELFQVPGVLLPLREARSDLGVWRSATEIAGLAGPGWTVTTSVMQSSFLAAHYRFDALLVRAP